jgi:PleD family two-component response regulator
VVRKILLIDDQPHDNRRAIRKLAETGYEVVMAYGPMGAVFELRQHPDIDLVILDCILPRENYDEKTTKGGTLTGHVLYKEHIEKLGIPVVIWSVLGQAFDDQEVSWGKSVILKARKRMEEDELVQLVERAESLLASGGHE